ncbi:MAG: hypothetical protein ABR867_06520 [Nitrososphaerales archaeon]|jgi:hypothetical protein
MTDYSQAKPSRLIPILLLFLLLSGFTIFTPLSYAKTPVNASSHSVSSHVQTPSWLLSLLKSHASNKSPPTTKGAIPMAINSGRKVDVKGQNAGNLIYYTPSNIRSAYNTTSLLSGGYDGTGYTISIVDAFGDPYIQYELDDFSSTFGIPSTTVNVICVDGPCDYSQGISTGWNGEIALDVEWAHAMAPGATINLYIGSNNMQPLYDGVLAAVLATNGNGTYFSPSDIVSMSWGSPENDFGESATIAPMFGENYPWLNYVFQWGSSEGITFFASSGDWGAYDQGFGQTSPYGGAIYPSTDPFVTGVGGTSLYLQTTTGYLQYPAFNATGGYGAESGWSWNNWYGWSTGGGFSTFFNQPSWQSGLGVPSHKTRGDPDVAWNADVLTGVVVDVEGGFYIFGGTSEGSPAWAGAMALMDQYAGRDLGFINPSLYSILNNPPEYAKTFHDVTVGNNDPLQAGRGWDPLTGIGSPNVGELAYYLPQALQQLDVIGYPPTMYGASSSYTSVQIGAGVWNASGTVTTGTGVAEITSSSGTLVADIPVAYNATAGYWTGTYLIKPTDPPGMWEATIRITSSTQTGTGYTTFSVGDGITIFSSWGTFLVGQSIPIRAIITAPDGSNITSGSFSGTFTYLYPSGPVQGTVPLTYNSTSERWEGTFAIGSSVRQGAWVLSIGGTDSGGNRAAVAYSWVSIGWNAYVYTDSPTYVLGDTIEVYSYMSPSSGSFNAAVYHNGQRLETVALSYDGGWWAYIWTGDFISNSDPAGFYNIVVTGSDGAGNSAYGETLVRVAPQELNVTTFVSEPYVIPGGSVTEVVYAQIEYPNGVPVTMGSVDAYSDGYYFPMTYQADYGEFVAFIPSSDYYSGYNGVNVVAFDPWGNVGEGYTSFDVISPSTTTLYCSGPVTVGSPSICTATVSGYYPSGEVDFTSSGSGTFSPTTCTLSYSGTCTVVYIPGSTIGSPHTINATYLGDSYNYGSSGTSDVEVDQATSTTMVICISSKHPVGTSTACVVTVTDDFPTGTVHWSQSGTGRVAFSPASATCTLSSTQCLIFVRGTKPGSVTLTATYGGDVSNIGSYKTTKVTISKAPTTISLSCKSTSKDVWTCTASLKGYFGSVKGERIGWSKLSGTGKVSFSAYACTLSSTRTCSVTVKGTHAGAATIKAAYAGDANNLGSYKTTTLTVK